MHLIQLAFALFLLPALGCATEAPPDLEVSDRVLKGFRADIAKYPYQVAVYIHPRKNENLIAVGPFGGSIISKNFILTAAHCLITENVIYNPVTAGNLMVYPNRSIVQKPNHGAEIFYVKNIFFHPHANITPPAGSHVLRCIENDVAILQLTKPLTLGPGIQVIPLAKANTKVRVNTKGNVSGYGQTKFLTSSNPSGQLYAAEVEIADDTFCKECYACFPLKNIICAGKVNNAAGILHGDSGGPLVVNGVLEGITACLMCPSMNCPDAFARIANNGIRDFIKKVTGI